jgi:hypothetical protein
MSKLSVDLQEGFQNDTVRVRVDDAAALEREGLSTRRQIGLAARLELEAPEGSFVLHVEVPTRALATSERLDAARGAFVGVNITAGGKLELRVQAKEFWYA